MLLKWFRRVRYRYRWRRCKKEPTPQHLIQFLNRDLGQHLNRYRTSKGIGHQRHFSFSTVDTFHRRLSLALDIVRQNEFTDRYDKQKGNFHLSIDEYLSTQQGFSIDPSEALESVRQTYAELITTCQEKEDKRRKYYMRHFHHLTEELFSLTSGMVEVIDL